MLKTAFALALKRHWGLVAVVLLITATSDWRHDHNISVSNMLVALLAALTLLCLAAVPVEFYKLRKSR
jgi:hypothetical protein